MNGLNKLLSSFSLTVFSVSLMGLGLAAGRSIVVFSSFSLTVFSVPVDLDLGVAGGGGAKSKSVAIDGDASSRSTCKSLLSSVSLLSLTADKSLFLCCLGVNLPIETPSATTWHFDIDLHRTIRRTIRKLKERKQR